VTEPRRALRASLVLALLGCIAQLSAPRCAVALCGDLNGDGRVLASDALAALRMVTTGGYDARADVSSPRAADGLVTATDALQILRGALVRGVSGCAAAVETRALVVTAAADFATGGLAEIDLRDFHLVRHLLGVTTGDSVVRTSVGGSFVLNRFGANNVQRIDPDAALKTLSQCSTASVGTNPHDMAAVSATKAYVSLYDSPYLAVVDPSADGRCSGFVRGKIDLSSLADGDGIPEMDQLAVVGNDVFVSLQRLDRNRFFLPAASGLLAIVDTRRDELVGTVELAIANPFAETKGLSFDPHSGMLYVGGPGTLFSDLADGGIERIDPSIPASSGILVDGAALGGDLTDFVVVGSARAYAIVADARFVASIVEVDLGAGTVVDTLMTSPFQLSDMEVTEDGILCVADRHPFDPGLRCFDIASNSELTSAPIYPGLSPFNLVFLP